MFILKKEHQPGVYMPLKALFLVFLLFFIFAPPTVTQLLQEPIEPSPH